MTLDREDLLRMDEKLDEINDELVKINVTLAQQHVQLAEHIRRTALLEEQLEYIQKEELKPIHQHVNRVDGALKLLGLVSLIVALASGAIELVSFFVGK